MNIFGLVIMTQKQRKELIKKAMDGATSIERHSTWTAINPVIHDLEKLRANTWDQDRITKIQNWLINNFEVNDVATSE